MIRGSRERTVVVEYQDGLNHGEWVDGGVVRVVELGGVAWEQSRCQRSGIGTGTGQSDDMRRRRYTSDRSRRGSKLAARHDHAHCPAC